MNANITRSMGNNSAEPGVTGSIRGRSGAGIRFGRGGRTGLGKGVILSGGAPPTPPPGDIYSNDGPDDDDDGEESNNRKTPKKGCSNPELMVYGASTLLMLGGCYETGLVGFGVVGTAWLVRKLLKK